MFSVRGIQYTDTGLNRLQVFGRTYAHPARQIIKVCRPSAGWLLGQRHRRGPTASQRRAGVLSSFDQSRYLRTHIAC